MRIKIIITIAAITIFAISSTIITLKGLRFKSQNFADLYNENENSCRLTSLYQMDQIACREAAAKSFLLNDKIELVYVFDHLCNNGLESACYTKDWFNYIYQSVLYTPPKDDLSLYINNCFNYKNKYIEKAYYCNKLEQVAKLLGDKETISSIKVFKCEGNPGCDFSNEDFINANSVLSRSFFQIYCMPSANHPVCNQVTEAYQLKVILNEALNSKKAYEHLKKIVLQKCLDPNKSCNAFINHTDFLQLAFIYKDLHFFKLLPLNSLAASFIISAFDNSQTSEILTENEIVKIKSKSMRYMILKYLKKHELIRKECKLEKDKTFCHFSFVDIEDAKKRLDDVNQYCIGGDLRSCDLQAIFKHSLDKDQNGSLDINFGLLNLKESLLAKKFSESLAFKISSFISQNRNLLVLILVIALILFLIYITHLYLKSEHVFKHIRQKMIEDLKNKLEK